jgi:HSP20 family protein
MVEAETKVPVKSEKRAEPTTALRPLESLRREINHLFDGFHWGGWPFPAGRTAFDLEPFWRSGASVPTVDIAEKDDAYEVNGREERRGQRLGRHADHQGRKERREGEKKKDYHLSERRYGSFHRSFRLPDSVDADKIGASFKNGVLTITMPRTPEAKKKQKKIEIKKG